MIEREPGDLEQQPESTDTEAGERIAEPNEREEPEPTAEPGHDHTEPESD